MKTDPCNCFATNIKTVNKKKPLKVFWINNSVYRCRCRNQCCIVKKGGNASTKKEEPQCEIQPFTAWYPLIESCPSSRTFDLRIYKNSAFKKVLVSVPDAILGSILILLGTLFILFSFSQEFNHQCLVYASIMQLNGTWHECWLWSVDY